MLEVISYSKAEQIKFTESILKKKKSIYKYIFKKKLFRRISRSSVFRDVNKVKPQSRQP